jgi:hypothetical protein
MVHDRSHKSESIQSRTSFAHLSATLQARLQLHGERNFSQVPPNRSRITVITRRPHNLMYYHLNSLLRVHGVDDGCFSDRLCRLCVCLAPEQSAVILMLLHSLPRLASLLRPTRRHLHCTTNVMASLTAFFKPVEAPSAAGKKKIAVAPSVTLGQCESSGRQTDESLHACACQWDKAARVQCTCLVRVASVDLSDSRAL